MAEISSIILPNGSAHALKDASSRAACALLSTSKADISAASKVIVKDPSDPNYENGLKTDLSVIKLPAAEYEALVAADQTEPNVLYVVSSDYIDAYGQQIKNISAGTSPDDAVSLQQVSSMLDGFYLKTETSSAQQISAAIAEIDTSGYVTTSRKVAGQALSADVTAAAISSAIGLSNYSLTSHTHSGYVPTSRKVNNKQLSSDITLGAADVGAVSLGGDQMTGELTTTGFVGPYWATDDTYFNGFTDGGTGRMYAVVDNYVIHFPQLTADDGFATSSMLSSYSLTSHTHSNYLTAVPSTYKTYADTLSSLSSDGYVPTRSSTSIAISAASYAFRTGNNGSIEMYAGNKNFVTHDFGTTNTTSYFDIVSPDSKWLEFAPGSIVYGDDYNEWTYQFPSKSGTIAITGDSYLTSETSSATQISIALDGVAQLQEVTWAELTALKNGSQLVPGKQYKITDYVATTVQLSSVSASKPFDVIVTADTTAKLNENARAAEHAGNTYFSDGGADPSKWSLKYCLENDTARFAWADSTNGKGVIYWMRDEWDNECPYDFKGLKMNNLSSTGEFFTFSSSSTSTNATDNSLDGKSVNVNVYSNKIGAYLSSGKYCLNRITFKGQNCNNNKIGEDCYDCSFGTGACNNIVGNGCYNITTSGSSVSNRIGNLCHDCILVVSSHSVFGSNCSNIKFNRSNRYHIIGSNCSNITIGLNTQNVTIGNNCANIKFGNADGTKNFYKNIIIESGNCDINLYCSGTTSSISYYQNVRIGLGVHAEGETKTITDPNTNQSFMTEYKPIGTLEAFV